MLNFIFIIETSFGSCSIIEFKNEKEIGDLRDEHVDVTIHFKLFIFPPLKYC